MKEVTLRLLSDLSLALEEDPRLSSLQQEEESLSLDKENAALLEEAKKAREAYLTLRLECGEEDAKTIEAKKAFHQAKLALEEAPEVAEYRKRYAAASDLYRRLDEILFGEYRDHLSCKENHAAR